MKLTWERFSVRTEHPFTISRSTREEVERLWVRVGHEGLGGMGEAAPTAYYGEDPGSAAAALEAMRPAVESVEDPEGLEELEAELALRAPGGASARAAVSAALHDLWGRRLGRPLWRLWGLAPEAAPVSSFTLGLDEPEVVAEKARGAAGWPVLKLKLGLEDGGREAALLDAVRAEAPEATLRVDANAGWPDAATARERTRVLADRGVELVEQPLPPDDGEGLRRLQEDSPLPIVLDESCLTAGDVPGLADRAHGVNLKMAKTGGPREALRAIHAARACGLKVMLGCMVGTTLGVAPAMHLAPLADWVDLDGPALLAEDPFRGPRLEEGRILLPDEPGLGVAPRG
mgnify:CR=1 FL=1